MPSFKKMEPMSRALRPGGAGQVNPQDVSGSFDLGTAPKAPKGPSLKMPRAPAAPKMPTLPQMPKPAKFR